MKKVITAKSEKFLENYLNNPSPTGFESEGQNYGWNMSNHILTIISLTITDQLQESLIPEWTTKWSSRPMLMKFQGSFIILPRMVSFISDVMEVLIT